MAASGKSDPSPASPETYVRWRNTTLGRITEELEVRLVFELAGALRGRRVLDVGCGDGTYAIEAATRGAVVTALDSDARMLDAARKRADERHATVTFVPGDATRLPLPDASFDVVIGVTVLCLVKEPALGVREMARVLAPGGRVVLGELSRYSCWAASRRARSWLGMGEWRAAHFWSRAELRGLAAQAGLRVRDEGRAVCFPPVAPVARALAPLDAAFARLGVPGAAFIGLAAGVE